MYTYSIIFTCNLEDILHIKHSKPDAHSGIFTTYCNCCFLSGSQPTYAGQPHFQTSLEQPFSRINLSPKNLKILRPSKDLHPNQNNQPSNPSWTYNKTSIQNNLPPVDTKNQPWNPLHHQDHSLGLFLSTRNLRKMMPNQDLPPLSLLLGPLGNGKRATCCLTFGEIIISQTWRVQ